MDLTHNGTDVSCVSVLVGEISSDDISPTSVLSASVTAGQESRPSSGFAGNEESTEHDFLGIDAELDALYFDFHVHHCTPRKSVVQEPPPASEVAEPSCNAVASLLRLCHEFPHPPKGARSTVITGDAKGPLASLSLVDGYVEFLLERGFIPSPSSQITPSGDALKSASLSYKSPEFLQEIHLLPCGCLGALAFALPPPYASFTCVAWMAAHDVLLKAPVPEGVTVMLVPSISSDASKLSRREGSPAMRATDVDAAPRSSTPKLTSLPPTTTPMTFNFFLLHTPQAGETAFEKKAGASDDSTATQDESTTHTHMPPEGAPASSEVPSNVALRDSMSTAAKSIAEQTIQHILHARWEEYRCYRVWRQLRDGTRPTTDELKEFLGTLRVIEPLESVFPSLESLRRLQAPWHELLDHLSTSVSSVFSCRWSSEGSEHLILFTPRLDADGTGRLVYCRCGTSGRLHAHACSTSFIEGIDQKEQLITEESHTIANAIVCWVWLSLQY